MTSLKSIMTTTEELQRSKARHAYDSIKSELQIAIIAMQCIAILPPWSCAIKPTLHSSRNGGSVHHSSRLSTQ
jgi:hypothetical protein